MSAVVDRILRRRAKEAGRSLHAVALDALAEGAGVAAPHRYDDLDGFLGSWKSDVKIERTLDDQRSIDEDLWK